MDIFTQPSAPVSTYSISSPCPTCVTISLEVLGSWRTFSPSVLAIATVCTSCAARIVASGPVCKNSRLTYPSTSPDLIWHQPSFVSMTSHAASLGSLPTSLPSVEGTALIFRLPDSTLATPILVYPQEAPCASCAIWIYSSRERSISSTDAIPPEAISVLLPAADAEIGDASMKSAMPAAMNFICLFFLFFIIKTFQLNSFYEFVTNLLHHDIDYSLHS